MLRHALVRDAGDLGARKKCLRAFDSSVKLNTPLQAPSVAAISILLSSTSSSSTRPSLRLRMQIHTPFLGRDTYSACCQFKSVIIGVSTAFVDPVTTKSAHLRSYIPL
jgi:hypothetical protein